MPLPLTPYEVDWPLSRRGKEDPIRRDKTQGDLPWEEETSTALVVLHQHVSRCVGWMGAPSFFAEPVVRLTVAGRDEAKAISNWQMIAKELRRFRQVRSAGLSRDGNVIDSRLPDKHIDEHY